MEIKRTQQSLQITKVEEDQRSTVKETKPLGVNQTPDSFELGRSNSGDTSSASGGTAVAPKTDSIADQQLNNQLIQARLGSVGARDQNEVKGKKDLTREQQEMVKPPTVEDPGITSPDTGIATGPRIPNGAFTGDARSRIDGQSKQLRDYLAQQGVDFKGGGGGGISSGGGTPSGMANGNYPGAGVNPAVGDAFAGGPTGPGNPFDNINQPGEQQIAGLGDLEQYAQTGPKAGIGKGMIANDTTGGVGYGNVGGYDAEEGLRGGTGNAAKNHPGLAAAVKQTYVEGGSGSPRAEMLKAAEDEINSNSGQDTKPATETKPKEDKYTEQEGGGWTRLDANGDTAATKTSGGEYEYFAKDKNGNWEQVDKEEYDKRKADADKKNGVSQPNPDDPESSGPRISTQNLPRAPRIRGDIDPAEDANKASGEYQPGLLQQFGKYGLVGQPGGPGSETSGGGGGVSLGQRGSNIDYEHGSGYMGVQREENPEDVDVSGAPMGQLNVVDREQKEEEEKKEKVVTTNKKRA